MLGFVNGGKSGTEMQVFRPDFPTLRYVINLCTNIQILWALIYSFLGSSLVAVNFQAHLYTARWRSLVENINKRSKVLDHLRESVVGDEAAEYDDSDDPGLMGEYPIDSDEDEDSS